MQAEPFPIYDAHGNMVNTLSRGSGGTFALGNSSFRYYDAWGSLDTGPGAGNEPRQRNCANLGHLQDDESGLIYMRARYYEPGTGRFVSEDPARDGINWYSYCGNEPIQKVDATGKFFTLGLALCGAVIGFITSGITALLMGKGSNSWKEALSGAAGGFVAGLVPVGAFGAGAINAFITSIVADILEGRAIRWGRAALAGGIGGLAGAILNMVASIGGRMEAMKNMTDIADDTTKIDEALGLLGGNLTSSFFDSCYP